MVHLYIHYIYCAAVLLGICIPVYVGEPALPLPPANPRNLPVVQNMRQGEVDGSSLAMSSVLKRIKQLSEDQKR